MSCGGCGTVIPESEDFLQCTIDGCRKIFHLPCVGEKTQSVSEWVCPECRCSSKRGGDNSLTPVGASKKHRDANVTLRKNISSYNQIDENIYQSENEQLSVEIRSLRQEMASLANELRKAVSLITSYETKLEYYAGQVQSVHTFLKVREPETAYSVAVAAACCPHESCRSPLPTSSSLVATPPPVSCPLGSSGVPAPVSTHSKVATVSCPPGPCGAPLPSRPSSSSTATTTAACLPVSSKVPPAVGAVSKTAKGMKMRTQPVPPASRTMRVLPDYPVQEGRTSPAAVSSRCPAEDSQPWTEVGRGRRRRPSSLCGTAGPTVTSLKAVEPRSLIHLWNMESGAEDIREYLKQLCPDALCTVTELTPKGDYRSYKIGVPVAYYETCMSTDVWPVNARIKAWVTHQKPYGPPPTKANQPFRGAAAAQ